MINDKGMVTYDSEKNTTQMDNHLARPEIKLAKASGIGSAIRYSNSLNKTLVYVAKKTPSNHFYRLALPLKYIESELKQFSKVLIIYTLVIFIFCLLVTLIMSRWISSPLLWTAKTLKELISISLRK